MTPADLARRLFRDQCNIGPNSSLEAYGETAAVKAMVPLIEALQPTLSMELWTESALDSEMVIMSVGTVRGMRAALTPQPEDANA